MSNLFSGTICVMVAVTMIAINKEHENPGSIK
jgi:uncharacterized membrane protein